MWTLELIIVLSKRFLNVWWSNQSMRMVWPTLFTFDSWSALRERRREEEEALRCRSGWSGGSNPASKSKGRMRIRVWNDTKVVVINAIQLGIAYCVREWKEEEKETRGEVHSSAMSSYTFEHPEGLSQDKVEFIQQFYRTSDTRDVEGVEFFPHFHLKLNLPPLSHRELIKYLGDIVLGFLDRRCRVHHGFKQRHRSTRQVINSLTSHLICPSTGRLMRVKRILTAVRKIRETMWGGVETRKHEPEKVYLADSEQNELMLYGTVLLLSTPVSSQWNELMWESVDE